MAMLTTIVQSFASRPSFNQVVMLPGLGPNSIQPGPAEGSKAKSVPSQNSDFSSTATFKQHSSDVTLSPEAHALLAKANENSRVRQSESSKSDKLKSSEAQATDDLASSTAQKLTDEERDEVEHLKERDREVKQHEQQHLASAGAYAKGGAHFDYQSGPDGKRYAVGGSVNIDTSPEKDAEATIRKAQTIRRAALAPSDPSGADHGVAAQAAKMEAEARKELNADAKTGETATQSPDKESRIENKNEELKGGGGNTEEINAQSSFQQRASLAYSQNSTITTRGVGQMQSAYSQAQYWMA